MNSYLKRSMVILGLATLVTVALVGAGCAEKPAVTAIKPPILAINAPASGKTPQPVKPPPVPATSGACRNLYFPLSNGYEIDYRVDAAGRSFNYAMRQSGVTDTAADVVYSFDDPKNFSIGQNVTCDSGNISDDGYLDIGAALSGMTKTTTTGVTGYVMPKTLTVGTSWVTTYEISAASGSDASGATVEMTGMVVAKNTAIAQETITVPAGQYLAIKVETEIASSMKVPGATTAAPPTRTVMYEWWAAGVGLIKTADAAGTMNVVATRVQDSLNDVNNP